MGIRISPYEFDSTKKPRFHNVELENSDDGSSGGSTASTISSHVFGRNIRWDQEISLNVMVCTSSTPILATSRSVILDVLGRNTLIKKSNLKRIGFVHSLTRVGQWNGLISDIFVSMLSEGKGMRNSYLTSRTLHLDGDTMGNYAPWPIDQHKSFEISFLMIIPL